MMGFLYRNGCGFYNGIFGGGWFFMICLFIVGLIVYIAYKSMKREDASKQHSNFNESLQILNLRLVKGEINEDEYKAKKAEILK